ncbi:MAG: phenylalanine--tRNA ligase subunit beta [Planctomycetota bacterium]
MNISLAWLNQYLDPGDVSAEEAAHVLTHAGYPVEDTTATPSGDTVMDVEITSNRGDLFCHVGCAREIAAARSSTKPRRLVQPMFDMPKAGPAIGGDLSLENSEPGVCPRFTARLIRGCRVGPSPDWLVERLEAVGQRSINNVVDVTNFITLELGNPCHVFDLAKLAGGRLSVRYANDGEALTTLDGKPRTLKPTDLVVADAEGATSLAGVIGGQDSEVDASTTDIIFEMATWDPVTVRTAARRLAIRTDASFRFERIVDPRTIGFAAERAVALIAELTGGTPSADTLDEGAPEPVTEQIVVRPAKCAAVIGVPVDAKDAADMLRGHEVAVEVVFDPETDETLRCVPPAFRPDLTREIDLIEEVARTLGYDAVPMTDRIAVRATHPQEGERARRAVASSLTGLGFYETVTFSFVRPDHAAVWYAPGFKEVRVDDDRRGEEPTLRPSVIPSLLLCRRGNADARAESEVGVGLGDGGGVRLFELSAVFAQTDAGASAERRVLSLLMDVEGTQPGKQPKHAAMQAGLRSIRGAVEAVCRTVAGPARTITVDAADPDCHGWSADGHGRVSIDGSPVGVFGPVGTGPLKLAGLDRPVMAAELDMDALIALAPPAGRVDPLPTYPAIERDLSLIVDESTRWAAVSVALAGDGIEHFESVGFVGTFRGDAVGAGKKSVTARLRFRSAQGTLRRDDVEPQMQRLVDSAVSTLGAEVRG